MANKATLLWAVLVCVASGCITATGVVRERAANEFSCDEGNIEVYSIGGNTYRAVGCGQDATYTCAAAVGNANLAGNSIPCVHDEGASSNSAQPAAQVQPPNQTAKLRAPPTGAGGFDFGLGQADAQRICEQAGHSYAKVSADVANCDGVAANIGADGRVELRFCSSKLCEVSIEVDPGDGQSLARTVGRFRGTLAEKYGPPTQVSSSIPLDCAKVLAACVADERAKIAFEWKWPSRYVIAVSAAKAAGQTGVKLQFSYSSPLFSQKAPGL
jgi:hypothetical protein